MLALSDAETGDVAVRTDLSKTFILKASPPSTLANWQELLTPESPVDSVNGMTGAVTVENISGNAGTATKLAAPVKINGEDFDGSKDITVADATKEPAITGSDAAKYWDGTKSWVDFATAVKGTVMGGLAGDVSGLPILQTDTFQQAITRLNGGLNQKANLASPTFTGTPNAPTAVASTNTTQIATTAFVKSQNYLDANSVIDGGTF